MAISGQTATTVELCHCRFEVQRKPATLSHLTNRNQIDATNGAFAGLSPEIGSPVARKH